MSSRSGEPAKTPKDLGLLELVAIALGGMIGGGIFSILGVGVEQVGNATPIAIAVGSLLALLAAWSYAKLSTYFQDEGATYSFFKRSYPESHYAAAAIGWLVVFGYISTLALYAFTFASYLGSLFPGAPTDVLRPALGGAILAALAILNIISVKLMGRLEDLMVTTKLVLLAIVTFVLYQSGSVENALPVWSPEFEVGSVFMVAALTFVAFEGFQLPIQAYSEVRDPIKNVPRAIYIAIAGASLIYILLAEGALWSLDKQMIIRDKEYALASGAASVLGPLGHALVIGSALLATASAISGTIFGASRLLGVIADDGYCPKIFAKRIHGNTPAFGIVFMAVVAWILVLSGGLELILEFGSLTFIVVSLLMAIANFKMRAETKSSAWLAIVAIAALMTAGILIIVWQFETEPSHLIFTVAIATILSASSGAYARLHMR